MSGLWVAFTDNEWPVGGIHCFSDLWVAFTNEWPVGGIH